jgi:hypothetical protein
MLPFKLTLKAELNKAAFNSHGAETTNLSKGTQRKPSECRRPRACALCDEGISLSTVYRTRKMTGDTGSLAGVKACEGHKRWRINDGYYHHHHLIYVRW